MDWEGWYSAEYCEMQLVASGWREHMVEFETTYLISLMTYRSKRSVIKFYPTQISSRLYKLCPWDHYLPNFMI